MTADGLDPPIDAETVDAFAKRCVELAEQIGPLLHGNPGYIVAGAISCVLGDLIAQQPPELWADAATAFVHRALRYAEHLLEAGEYAGRH